jgi:hypothetical protein
MLASQSRARAATRRPKPATSPAIGEGSGTAQP